MYFYGELLLALLPTPSWRTTPCRLFAAAYSVHSQLPNIAGGRPTIRNPRALHAVVASGLSTSYMLSNILVSRLSSYGNGIVVDSECGFQHNRSATGDFLHPSDAGEKIGVQ
jgi:hypothetical protein